MDDVKTCWRYCPLIDFLRDQEKIKSFAECHRIVDYGSTRWIVWRPAFIGEETRVYSFTDNHERNARSIIASLHFIARLKASSLSRFDYFIRFSLMDFTTRLTLIAATSVSITRAISPAPTPSR